VTKAVFYKGPCDIHWYSEGGNGPLVQCEECGKLFYELEFKCPKGKPQPKE
jgi:uncharacterized Zn finger protein